MAKKCQEDGVLTLSKNIIRTARWSSNSSKWQIEETLQYQWQTNQGVPKSPLYKDLNDALQWIITHDENLS